jgi:hypothetical protein
MAGKTVSDQNSAEKIKEGSWVTNSNSTLYVT